MNDDQKTLLNHSVVVVGYKLDSTLDPHCKDYFIVKKSYGTSWGENGYVIFCIYKDEAKYPYGMCNMY
jgi:C1A family cysteine protease